MSGGRSTLAFKSGGKGIKEQSGDISAVGELGHKLTNQYYLECKHYADLQIANFLTYKTGKLREFWDETVRCASTVGKVPLLLAKQNRFDDLVVTTPKFWEYTELLPGSMMYITYLPGLNAEVFCLEALLLTCRLING